MRLAVTWKNIMHFRNDEEVSATLDRQLHRFAEVVYRTCILGNDSEC